MVPPQKSAVLFSVWPVQGRLPRVPIGHQPLKKQVGVERTTTDNNLVAFLSLKPVEES